MEKLQAALARAREKREGGDPLRPRTTSQTRTSSRAAATEAARDALWAEIEHFEPSAKRLKQSRIYSGAATAEAQTFDILRTKLLLEMRRNNWTRVAITSAAAGSGKTTTACNLISGIGRQSETRAMLFDFDLRRPSVASFFGMSRERSVADVISGAVPFPEQAVRLSPNTTVSVATQSVRDPATILLQSQVSDVLDDIQAAYAPDMMIFDLPPVLVADETRGFLKSVDCAVIIAGAETTSIDQVDEAEREVSEYTAVAGVVLNKCRFVGDDYSYAY